MPESTETRAAKLDFFRWRRRLAQQKPDVLDSFVVTLVGVDVATGVVENFRCFSLVVPRVFALQNFNVRNWREEGDW